MKHLSKSVQQTQKIAEEISKQFVNSGGVIALTGELGAGKTTFTQGFAKALGITEKVISPTFVLIRQHQIPDSEGILYHIDLYRLEGEIKSYELGIDEMIENPKNIVLIEWAEKMTNTLPFKVTTVTIDKLSENERSIVVEKQ